MLNTVVYEIKRLLTMLNTVYEIKGLILSTVYEIKRLMLAIFFEVHCVRDRATKGN